MANLNDDGEEGVSLFPMFNILACTLGVMVFILATVATVSLGADKAVEFVAVDVRTGGRTLSPTWFEWDGEELVVHPSAASVRFDRDLRSIPTFEQTFAYIFDQIAGTPVGAEISRVSLDPGRYIILLVRPSGLGTLPEIRDYMVERLGIEVVAEPIDQDLRRLQVR